MKRKPALAKGHWGLETKAKISAALSIWQSIGTLEGALLRATCRGINEWIAPKGG